MPQLFKSFYLNLSNPLTTEVKPTANFLQGVHGFATNAESHAQDLFFARGECSKDAGDILGEILV